MEKLNRTHYLIILICLLYGFVINNYYRPFIYTNKINDYGIADIGNNITFIPGTYLLMRLFRQNYICSPKKDIIIHFIILSGVEIISEFIPHIGTFDIKDIVGLFIGALILFLFVEYK
jgi:hypothetical protein